MSPQEVKNLYVDQLWSDDSADRREQLGLRFAKRVKQVAPKTQFTTKARHARRGHSRVTSDASCRRSNRFGR